LFAEFQTKGPDDHSQQKYANAFVHGQLYSFCLEEAGDIIEIEDLVCPQFLGICKDL
jgi:hypothetical protein